MYFEHVRMRDCETDVVSSPSVIAEHDSTVEMMNRHMVFIVLSLYLPYAASFGFGQSARSSSACSLVIGQVPDRTAAGESPSFVRRSSASGRLRSKLYPM